MTGAISADHHGSGKKEKKVFAHIDFRAWYDFYVGIRREASYSKNSA